MDKSLHRKFFRQSSFDSSMASYGYVFPTEVEVVCGVILLSSVRYKARDGFDEEADKVNSGVGWNYRVKGIPEDHVRTKQQFFVDNLIWLGIVWLLIDITNVYIIENVYDGKPNPATMPFIDVPGSFFGRRFYNMFWGTLAMVYLPVQNLYTQIALISVLCGGGQPKDWPPIYGSKLADITTLRKVWNTFWHQTIRKTFTDWSHGLMNLLGIQKGTWLSTYFQLYLGFFMTGLGHGIVTYAMSYQTRDTNTLANRFFLFFNFFLLQAVAIHCEDFAIWCYKAWTGVPKGQDAQPKPWHRVVGIAWVLVVWCYTAKMAMLACIRNGISAEDSLPFSIVRPTLKLLGVL
ncbi:hypothetical protein MMC34_005267 [Xylographa carneopallida]|nr:hypothetical protein [Xylographa carneopallida]